MTDEELSKMAVEFYKKHKKALDFVNEQVENLLKNKIDMLLGDVIVRREGNYILTKELNELFGYDGNSEQRTNWPYWICINDPAAHNCNIGLGIFWKNLKDDKKKKIAKAALEVTGKEKISEKYTSIYFYEGKDAIDSIEHIEEFLCDSKSSNVEMLFTQKELINKIKENMENS